MTVSITKQMEISAAHWLPFHHGKCQHLHGHNYRFDVTVKGVVNPATNFLIDFGDLKAAMANTIGKWDHALLVHYDHLQVRNLHAVLFLNEVDPVSLDMMKLDQKGLALTEILGLGDVSRIVPIGMVTTAENLSQIAAEMIMERMPGNVHEVSVTCWETSNSSATSWVTRELREIVWEGSGWYTTVLPTTDIPRYIFVGDNRMLRPATPRPVEWFNTPPKLMVIIPKNVKS